MLYYTSLDEREILVKSTTEIEGAEAQELSRCTSWMYRWLYLKYTALFLVRTTPAKVKALYEATKAFFVSFRKKPETAVVVEKEQKEVKDAPKVTEVSLGDKAKVKATAIKDKSKRIKDIILE